MNIQIKRKIINLVKKILNYQETGANKIIEVKEAQIRIINSHKSISLRELVEHPDMTDHMIRVGQIDEIVRQLKENGLIHFRQWKDPTSAYIHYKAELKLIAPYDKIFENKELPKS